MRCYAILALTSVALAGPAPLFNRDASREYVPDKYIVKLKDHVSRSYLDSVLSTFEAAADQIYDGGVFNGFATTLSQDELEVLREDADVEYIEQDAIFRVPTVDVAEDEETFEARQVADPWNLIRISHQQNTGTSYLWDGVSGQGTCIYILDSGISVTHANFGGRATIAANFAGGSNTDVLGHGTAIAGVAAATQVGVSRRSRILSVKVYGDSGSGTTSGIIQGINFIASDAPTRGCLNGAAFVNFAGAGGFSAALNNAAAALVARGHFFAADAGSNGANVSGVSPASAVGVCSVGRTNRLDQAAVYNNYGAIDIYAPGVDILSLRPGSGTIGTPNVIQDVPGAILLYNGGGV